MKLLSCNAPYNSGGLGKVLAQVVEEARGARELARYYTVKKKVNDPFGEELSLSRHRWLFRSPPFRDSLGRRDFLAAELFDREVAKRLEPATSFHGFSGRASHSFSEAQKLKFEQLIIESATSHITHVRRQHKLATQAFAIEQSWLNRQQYKKTLREYELADEIYVLSEYARRTFLEAGIPEKKIHRRVLTVEPRFAPPLRMPESNNFVVVYVGRLQVSKGVPVLLKAFAALDNVNAQLILVGGSGTQSMEKYLRLRASVDPRITICAGDPLPFLHRADVLVHPTFEDGLALAPLEALACGVPVIVTEDTGMKEYVVAGRNGYIVPTGDVDALVDQLRAVQRRPLKGQFAAPGATHAEN